MDKLVISDDEGHTTVVPLVRDEITIGRKAGNTIRLTERNVSRSHARLLKRNGSYIVEDLGSYNGVTLNGVRIDTQAELAPGDQLGIGDYDLALQSDVVATANTLPAPKPRSLPPPRLVVLSDPAAGAEFTLNKSVLRIGRDERLDVWINHKSISHEHAELQVLGGKVTVFDLESANGMRVNGVETSRAVLESGDVLELGEVRFRFLPAQGAHSLETPPPEESKNVSTRSSQKPLVAILVLGLMILIGAGAVLVTVRGAPPKPAPSVAVAPVQQLERAEPTSSRAPSEQEPGPGGDSEAQAIVDEPREWEGLLTRARRALARGRVDRAFSIANDLPADSVLRGTPEFAEIRYRYAEAHLDEGERALQAGDGVRASSEAKLVLELEGITSKQRQGARRLMRNAREAQTKP
ncbi:MAG: FHA domain-containing protein [Polyangiales bacterium]